MIRRLVVASAMLAVLLALNLDAARAGINCPGGNVVCDRVGGKLVCHCGGPIH